MRGDVLNSAGVYNRCKLVVDTDWDKKVWQDSWQVDKDVVQLEARLAADNLLTEEYNKRGQKRRSKEKSWRNSKRSKRDDEHRLLI